MQSLGGRVRGPGRIYLTGGTTALLEGWRETTIDIDIKPDPEPAGLFEAIVELKESLELNVELAAPDDFIPALPGWQDRSRFITRCGPVDFFQYDFFSQALAKLERHHERDLADVQAMLDRGLITRDRLWEFFLAIEPDLLRFPGIDPAAFRTRVASFCEK